MPNLTLSKSKLRQQGHCVVSQWMACTFGPCQCFYLWCCLGYPALRDIRYGGWALAWLHCDGTVAGVAWGALFLRQTNLVWQIYLKTAQQNLANLRQLRHSSYR
eukprot:5244687-Amphidinium_carterae.1